MLDITSWQRYHAGKKALSALRAADCGEATLWEHCIRCPKLDKQSELIEFRCKCNSGLLAADIHSSFRDAEVMAKAVISASPSPPSACSIM